MESGEFVQVGGMTSVRTKGVGQDKRMTNICLADGKNTTEVC